MKPDTDRCAEHRKLPLIAALPRPSARPMVGEMFKKSHIAFIFCILFTIYPFHSSPADQGVEPGCVRGEPEPLFSRTNPQIKSHSFARESSTEATEEIVSLSGDRIITLNGGCEYYVNSFRYESAGIQARDHTAVYWGAETAKALRKLQALRPSLPFDLTKVAEALEKLVKERGTLSVETEIPVEGDGTDFLQTRVVLKGGGILQGKAGGYVAFDLVKGPL